MAHSMEQGSFAVSKEGGKVRMCVIFKGKATHHLISKDPESGNFLVNKKAFGEANTLDKVSVLMPGLVCVWLYLHVDGRVGGKRGVGGTS